MEIGTTTTTISQSTRQFAYCRRFNSPSFQLLKKLFQINARINSNPVKHDNLLLHSKFAFIKKPVNAIAGVWRNKTADSRNRIMNWFRVPLISHSVLQCQIQQSNTIKCTIGFSGRATGQAGGYLDYLESNIELSGDILQRYHA